MASIEQILMEQARLAGDSRRQRGAIWGQAIEGVSQIPGQILRDRAAQAQARRELERQAQADARADADLELRGRESERQDAELGMRQDAATSAQQQVQRAKEAVQAWVKQHATKLKPEEADGLMAAIETPDGLQKATELLARPPAGFTPLKLEKVETRNSDGSTTIQFVAPEAGQTFTSSPEAAKVTFGAPQPFMVGGRRTLVRAGSDGKMYDLKGSVVEGVTPDVPPQQPQADNEPLVAVIGDDGQPVLVPRSKAAGRRPASTREQGRPVTSGDAGRMADFDTSLDDLNVLGKAITETKDSTGTTAAIGAALPAWVTDLTGWGTNPKKRQGVIDRVKQVIGKTLEGGVLRKEDEVKYEKILPTIRDTPAVAASKLKGLNEAITLRRQTFLDALADAGYETGKYNARAPRSSTADPLGIR